jgi:multiple sugar transport system substrate-binding protein
MSMKRKALSLLSLLTLPMVLAACGNSEGSSNGDGAEGKTEIKITWRNTGKTIK